MQMSLSYPAITPVYCHVRSACGHPTAQTIELMEGGSSSPTRELCRSLVSRAGYRGFHPDFRGNTCSAASLRSEKPSTATKCWALARSKTSAENSSTALLLLNFRRHAINAADEKPLAFTLINIMFRRENTC